MKTKQRLVLSEILLKLARPYFSFIFFFLATTLVLRLFNHKLSQIFAGSLLLFLLFSMICLVLIRPVNRLIRRIKLFKLKKRGTQIWHYADLMKK